MKTTGESSIPKFLFLVFLGHPSIQKRKQRIKVWLLHLETLYIGIYISLFIVKVQIVLIQGQSHLDEQTGICAFTNDL